MLSLYLSWCKTLVVNSVFLALGLRCLRLVTFSRCFLRFISPWRYLLPSKIRVIFPSAATFTSKVLKASSFCSVHTCSVRASRLLISVVLIPYWRWSFTTCCCLLYCTLLTSWLTESTLYFNCLQSEPKHAIVLVFILHLSYVQLLLSISGFLWNLAGKPKASFWFLLGMLYPLRELSFVSLLRMFWGGAAARISSPGFSMDI